MKPVYQITEYGSFITGKKLEGYVTLPPHTFEQLEHFVLSNHTKDTDALELMSLSARRGVGKIITAKNYVGIITMNDGTTIEILPKIHSVVADDASGTKAKRLLIEMLKTLRDTPYINLQMANMNIEKMNVFEIFIRMFIDEVFLIVKRGLKRNYESIEENTNFCKGKLKFSQHIKLNHSHKERSFVEYDVFSVNRPENRLLKSTLLYLYKHSKSSRNRTDIKSLLNSFAEVDASSDYKGDFAKYVPDRNMKDYSTALMWSRVFLMGKSSTMHLEMKKHDAFLMSSDYEGMPNALLEAMVIGLIAVSTDCRTGPKDIIDHGVNGYLTPVGNADEMAKHILHLTDMTAEEISAMARDGQRKVADLCDDKKSFDTLIRLIEEQPNA